MPYAGLSRSSWNDHWYQEWLVVQLSATRCCSVTCCLFSQSNDFWSSALIACSLLCTLGAVCDFEGRMHYHQVLLNTQKSCIRNVRIARNSFGCNALGLTETFCKGKAVPLQAWTGPEGSRKLRFPDFMTMAQDGGKVVSLMHRPPLPPGNAPGTHFC
jgi:hypothetical protein